MGSPEALAALRLVDQQIGLLQDRLDQLGFTASTDLIVTCDHGFDYEPAADVLAPVHQEGVAPDDMVVDSEGGGSLIYVKDHNPEKIRKLVEGFQKTDTTNVIFVPSTLPGNGTFRCVSGATKGWLPGTLALELANECMPAHGPDLIVTFHWNDAKNPFGVPGTQLIPGRAAHNGHGGLNPWTVRSTLLLAGPDFGRGVTSDVPAGNQDIAPTVLKLMGQTAANGVQGRVLSEAFNTPRASAAAKGVTRTMKASHGGYCAEVEVSSVGKQTYLNYGRRCAGTEKLKP